MLRRRRTAGGEAPDEGEGASRPWRRPVGVVGGAFDEAALAEALRALAEAGERAAALDRAVQTELPKVVSLSPLTESLAEGYVERIRNPLKRLDFETAVWVVTRGYVAHLLLEADPAAYGAEDVPVLGTLPALRHGRPPADLTTRVLRATRRGFEHIRALDADTWEGYVACTTWRTHQQAPEPEPDDEDDDQAAEPGYVDPEVIDALVRFGWVLRQVDIHYRQTPERAQAD